MTTSAEDARAQIVDAIRARQRFVIASHARPDGDAIGSSLAMHVHRQSAAAPREGRPSEWVRLLDTEGHLLAVATAGKSGDSLHPAVVLI